MFCIYKKIAYTLHHLSFHFLGVAGLLMAGSATHGQSLPVNVTLNTGYDPGNNDIEAVESIRILPNFHVPSGNTFMARIWPRNEYLPTDQCQ